MFLSDVATAAKQVFILYVLVLLGFICDRTKIYTEKAARLTNDLLFYIDRSRKVPPTFFLGEPYGLP